MDVIRANRQLAEKPCVACGTEVLLGEEVIQCPRCGGVHHRKCWEQRGGCAAQACAAPELEPVQAASPAGAAPQTITCPACAEQIPATARMCPYCSEALVDEALAPRSFKVKRRGRTWNFTIMGNELVGAIPGKADEVRIPHERGPLDVVLKKRRLTIAHNGKKLKFMLADDIAPVVVNYWLTGRLEPCKSYAAGQALMLAILGIFIFRIILSPIALYKAFVAGNRIKRYHGLLTGGGSVLAAKIISITMICLTVVAIIVLIIFVPNS